MRMSDDHAARNTALSQPGRGGVGMAVFVSGMVMLGIEIAGVRMLGPTFGTSNVVWANVIGLVLVFLATGNLVGGWLADRSPRPSTLFRLLLWAAALSAAVPLASRPTLALIGKGVDSLSWGIAPGSFMAALILLAPPLIALGCVTPVAIRLSVSGLGTCGRTAGTIQALSTMGSLVGTFTATFVLIPRAGVTASFVCLSVAAALAGLAGLARYRRETRAVGTALPLALWAITAAAALCETRRPGALRADVTLLMERESAYNLVRVGESRAAIGTLPRGTTLLFLNETVGIHSVWNEQSRYGGYWEIFLAAPFVSREHASLGQVRRVCIVGLAAGTASTLLIDTLGQGVHIDGIEIDPVVVEAGRRFFGMNQKNLRVIVGDGRVELRRSKDHYDLIVIDAYRMPYIPWHLTTREFFSEVRDHLSLDGVVAINVTRGPRSRALVQALTATLLDVYGAVHTVDPEETLNSVLIATPQITDFNNLVSALESQEPRLPESVSRALVNAVRGLHATEAGGAVLTDDLAPAEAIVNDEAVWTAAR